MIEIVVTLTEGGVVFVGENVACSVVFRNVGSLPEVCAWGSAQVHCQLDYNRSKVRIPERSSVAVPGAATATSSSYAFAPMQGERGVPVYTSPAHILFCDLRLEPGQEETFTYSSTVPLCAPPSYRGDCISYSYKITVGMQRLGSSHPAEMLRLPFRVLPLTEDVVALRRRSASSPTWSPVHAQGHLPSSPSSSVSSSLSSTVVSASTTPIRERGEKEKKDKGDAARLRSSSLPPPLAAGGATPSSGRRGLFSQFSPGGVRLRLGSAETGSETNSVIDSLLDVDLKAAAEFGMTVAADSSLLRQPHTIRNIRNPFVTQEVLPQSSDRPQTMHALASLSRKRKPHVFKIGTGDRAVVRFFISKCTFRLGEDVLGWFDFSVGNVPCYQITVALECIEEIHRDHNIDKIKERTSIFAKTHEFCRHKSLASVMLPIPLCCCAQFSTPIVTVSWRLSFEFIIGSAVEQIGVFSPPDTQDLLVSAPNDIEGEVLKWSLPIYVLPTNPLNMPVKTVSQALRC
eukprot:m.129745 g.129745  ORF g.129745 m.129745 type:complete len:515 (-) comp19957_c0_seq3:67-1611(-)